MDKKNRIKECNVAVKMSSKGVILDSKKQLRFLEEVADNRALNQEELSLRAECRRVVMEADRQIQIDIRQKARIRWVIEGDEIQVSFTKSKTQILVTTESMDSRLMGFGW